MTNPNCPDVDLLRQLDAQHCLPPAVFTSSDWFDFERMHLLQRLWNFVGLAQTVPEAGDYFTTELYGESLIVVLGRDGRIRAFANVCRHRCSRLLEGTGSVKAIRCPFHAWTYHLDGKLAGAPSMGTLSETDKTGYRLRELRLDSWQGLLFVSFSATVPPISECLAEIPAEFHQYPLKDMVCVRERCDRVGVNWKLYNDVDTDPGHGPVHQESIGSQEYDLLTSGRYARSLYMRQAWSSALLPGDRDAGFPHIADLPGRAATGTLYLQFYPALYVIMTQDCAWWLNKTPVDADTSILRVGYMFPEATVARPDFAEKIRTYFARWDKVVEEDNWIMEMQQQGMRSAFSRAGPYSAQDAYVRDLHGWYAARMRDALDHGVGIDAPTVVAAE